MTSILRVASLYSLTNKKSKQKLSTKEENFIDKNILDSAKSNEKCLLKAIKCFIKKQNKINTIQRDREIMLDEWKEVARRMDEIMLFINFLVVTTVPIYLFGRYAIFDNKAGPTKECSCHLN